MTTLTLRVALLIFLAFFSSACCKLLSFNSPAGRSSSSNPNSSSSNNQRQEEPSAPQTNNVGFTRPPLAVQRGQFFTWAMPANWRGSETGNGVDMISPDGKLAASAVLLTGNPGQTTPWDFLTNIMGKLGATDINQVSAHDLPPAPSGYPGVNWEIQEFELTFNDAKGVSQHADSTCGILNAYGGYSVILQSFSSPENEYDQAKTWLPLLPQSVAAIDPGKIAYQDQLIPVRNHPLDNSGLRESQREGMMGYERMVSPTTGQYYNMPLERYDGTVGGYRNPDHPDEILSPTQP